MYQRAKIYKIIPNYDVGDEDDGDVYIGSTCEKYLSNRLSGHRTNYKAYKKGKYHNISIFKLFDKYGIDGCQIVLLEKFPCDSKEELHIREGFHIKSMDCVNKVVAGRTHKQYYQDNKEKILNRVHEYASNNKEKIAEHGKQYRIKHADKIKAHKMEKHICICGSTYTSCHKTRHERTKKHLKYITNISESDSDDSDSDDE